MSKTSGGMTALNHTTGLLSLNVRYGEMDRGSRNYLCFKRGFLENLLRNGTRAGRLEFGSPWLLLCVYCPVLDPLSVKEENTELHVKLRKT